MHGINGDDFKTLFETPDNKYIKPIETVYQGYKFRSRLEARWAVFFDVLGIRYEYEKEGFDLGADGWYLPDFWLPDFNRWVEIKPGDIGPEEYRKPLAFSNIIWQAEWDAEEAGKEHNAASVFLIAGDPYAQRDRLLTEWKYAAFSMLAGKMNQDYPYYWTSCPLCRTIDLRTKPWPANHWSPPLEWALQCMYCDITDRDHADKETEQTRFHKGTVITSLPMHAITLDYRLQNAYIMARQARFEHMRMGE